MYLSVQYRTVFAELDKFSAQARLLITWRSVPMPGARHYAQAWGLRP